MWKDTGRDGWIGSWSPGIGDPTFVGWLTVVLYFIVAWRCAKLAMRTAQRPHLRSETKVWAALSAILFALCVNKQLDLQSALTELGRVLAHQQGWYDQRGEVQRLFIGAIALVGTVGAAAAYALSRRVPPATRLALVGLVVLGAFVVIRAASFHHVDAFLGSDWLGLRANWILEIGGISIIGLGTARRVSPSRSAVGKSPPANPAPKKMVARPRARQ